MGDILCYLVDAADLEKPFYEVEFDPTNVEKTANGITRIDHIGHTVGAEYFQSNTLFYRTMLGLNIEESLDLFDPNGIVHSRVVKRELVKQQIQFVIRIKNNRKCLVWFNKGIKNREVKIKVLHRYMVKKGVRSQEIILAGDYIAQLIVLENTAPQPDEPFLYLITTVDDIDQAAQLYRMRWKIECCFKHLKTNGFNLEALL